MLTRAFARRASLLTEILEKFSEHRGGTGSQWLQETQYEYRLNPDGKSATVAGTVRGEARRAGKAKAEAYAGVFGGEVDEQGHFKTGGLRKFFRDEKGHEKTESRGDEPPDKFLAKLGLQPPKELSSPGHSTAAGAGKTALLGEMEDVMDDLLTPPRATRRQRALPPAK